MLSIKNKSIRVVLALFLIITLSSNLQTVQASSQDPEVNIYMFWGEGCPHCEKARPVLQKIVDEDARIGYFEFEVYHDPENLQLFKEFGSHFGFEPQGIPTIFIGDRYWVGYSENIRAEIESYLNDCLAEGCPDPGSEILSAHLTVEPTPTPVVTDPVDETPDEAADSILITLPLIGTVNLSEHSLLLSTLLISIVDGFNPCSIWVLSMLLAITLNSGSRKRVLIIGFVFIFVTGLIYAMFIGGLFTIFSFISFVGWIQVIVALVALTFALVNIKDYFWYKEGLSFTISDEKKPGIYKGIRRVMNADQSIWGLIGATVVLAAGVSLVEFSCTAGFPMLWTNLLATHEVTGLAFLGFLFIYMFVYQIDELGIFLVSVYTLRKTKLEEKHGRILKLLGGMLMLTLAAVMLINPSIMNDITSSLLVFGAAFGLTAIVLFVHRVLLPKLNIKIGSE